MLRRSTQIPHQTRMYLSKVFGIAETRIQVLADDAAGGFGAKRAARLGRPLNGSNYAPGPCRVSNYRSHVRCVVTNKGRYSAYRGYGEDLANMRIERVLDQATDRLEIDPVEIRKRNLPTHYPHQTVAGPVIEQGSISEALAKLVEVMDRPKLRAEQADALSLGRHLGIALAPYLEPAGFAFPGSAFQNYEAARTVAKTAASRRPPCSWAPSKMRFARSV